MKNKKDCSVTFCIVCTKASAEPRAETHNTTLLVNVPKDICELIFVTSKKNEGAISVNTTVSESLIFRKIIIISSIFCAETCDFKDKFQVYNRFQTSN